MGTEESGRSGDLGSLSNNHANGYKNVTEKCSCAVLNLIALILSHSIRQILATFSGVEF